jgi:hypothetical protein
MRTVTTMLVLTFALLASACKNAIPANEQFREQPGKAVYRSADEETREEPAIIAPQEKVPGE